MDRLLAFVGLERRTGQEMELLVYIAKVLSIGCMVQSAVLFPLASEQAQWFQHTTLSIFILTTVAFTAVNSELLVQIGLYTVPAALILLVFVVMQPGSPRKELLPWLPAFVASVNVITLAIGKINEQSKARQRSSTLEDGLANVPIETWSNRSSPGPSSRVGVSSREPSESSHHGPAMFGRYGPSSQCSRRTGDSEMSLSDGPGRCRSGWDPFTLGFFPDRGSRTASSTSAPWNSAGLAAIRGFGVTDMDLVSEAATAASGQPLLGQQPNA